MHHGLFGGAHAEHEFHNLPIEPYHGRFQKKEHEQVYGGGVVEKGKEHELKSGALPGTHDPSLGGTGGHH